jgi:hypothetical protein
MSARIAAEATFEEASVIRFKDCQAGVEQLALGNDDDIEALRDRVTTENLSNQAFCSVSHYCPAQLPCRRDAQTRDALVVGQDEHRAEAASDSRPAVVYLLIFDATSDPMFSTKSHRFRPSADLEAEAES